MCRLREGMAGFRNTQSDGESVSAARGVWCEGRGGERLWNGERRAGNSASGTLVDRGSAVAQLRSRWCLVSLGGFVFKGEEVGWVLGCILLSWAFSEQIKRRHRVRYHSHY